MLLHQLVNLYPSPKSQNIQKPGSKLDFSEKMDIKKINFSPRQRCTVAKQYIILSEAIGREPKINKKREKKSYTKKYCLKLWSKNYPNSGQAIFVGMKSVEF